MKTLIPLLGLLWLLFSCTSINKAAEVLPGITDELTSLEHDLSVDTATDESWENSAARASFVPGVSYQGGECVEMECPYGETAVVWQFTGLEAGAEISPCWAVNLDFFDTESWLSIAYLPGLYEIDAAFKPREVFNEHIVYKWADGDAAWPASTDGWEILDKSGRSDSEGNLTVIMIVTKRGDRPPVIYQHFTNPVIQKHD